jgi:hypothetical protein
VVLRTDRVQAAAGRSLRRTDHTYFGHGGALGGNATVEERERATSGMSGHFRAVYRELPL